MSFKIVIAFVLANGPFVSHIQAPTYPKYFETLASCESLLDNPDFKADISALGDRMRDRTKTNVITTAQCVDAGNEQSAPEAKPPPKAQHIPLPPSFYDPINLAAAIAAVL